MAVSLQWKLEAISASDTTLTNRQINRTLTTYSGTAGLTNGGPNVVVLAAGATNIAVILPDLTNIRFLIVLPERDCIIRQVAGDTGHRVAAGKAFACEYSSTGAPTAILLTNTDGAATNEVTYGMVGT